MAQPSAAANSLSLASEAARQAGLATDLTSKLSTVFAPSDDAVAAYAVANPSAATDIASSGGALAVTAHVIPNVALTSADLKEGDNTFTSVAGTPIVVRNSGGKLQVSSGLSSANIIKSDITSENAVIHLIDNVLAPVA